MKRLFFIVFIFFTNLLCAANFTVLDFVADGVERSFANGTYETFVSNFKPAGFTLVSKMNVRKTAEDMGVQYSTATPQQMKPVMDKLGITHIVFGKVGKIKGEYVVSVSFVKAGNPPDSAIAREEVHFTASYVEPVKTLAQNLAKKLKGGKGGDSKTPAKSAKIKNGVGVVYGYLKVFPKDLGFFNSVPEDIIKNINVAQQYGYNTWRVPTENELALLVSEKYIKNAKGYMSDVNESGNLRLVTDKDTADMIAVAMEEEEQSEAERAKYEAERAKYEAEQAKREAERAKREAERAKYEVEQAKREAERAEREKREAEEAKNRAEREKRDAEIAKWNAERERDETKNKEKEEPLPQRINYDTPADNRLEWGTKRLNFGIGVGFEGDFGLGVGFDWDWKIFEQPDGAGAGKMWLGFGLDFQYWIPVEIGIPIQLNYGYEFNLNNRILRYIGVWYSMGFGMGFLHPKDSETRTVWTEYGWEEYTDSDDDYYTFTPSFAWQLYMSMIFESRFIMDLGFAGFSGADWERSYLLLDIGCLF